MRVTKIIFLAVSLMLAGFAKAQKGTVRGTVIDEVGEPLFSGNAVLKGTTIGTTTDFDGKYELKADPGTYQLVISFIGYQSVTITDVTVKAGEVTAIDPVKLEPSTSQLGEVTITVEQTRNTEAALLTVKKKSVNVLDGISAQTFRKIGDGDAAAAVTRVPGVSIQGGKYVYVRGLGDRYTKTTLNGLDIPGLDPDRNSLQMDIFPTNIISNITVVKSFTADLPADFVGGLVNIETKEFPEEPTLGVSASLGYTPGMHFNDEFLTQEGSPTDALGFDGSYRDEPLGMSPSNPQTIINPASSNSNAREQTLKFNKNLAAQQATSFMNFGLGASGGDQFTGEVNTYGYSAAISYKNSTDFYRDYQQNYWLKNRQNPDQYELQLNEEIVGDLGVRNVLVSGMLGGAMKTENAKYKINLMHLQNAEEKSGYFFNGQYIQNSALIFRDNLEYSERSISNALISGEHILNGGDFNIEWKVSPTYSRIEDKDVRITPYRYEPSENSYRIEPSEAGVPQRIWRNLSEINLASRLDFTWEHRLLGEGAKFKFGGAYTYKTRDYNIFNYNMESIQRGTLPFTGDADELLTEGFVYDPVERAGMFYFGNYQPNNTYEGVITNLAGYLSEEFRFAPRWKSILGVRMEKYDQYYTGTNQQREVLDNEKVLDLLDFFPTASVIFEMNEKTNIRASYFLTTARPSFKEKSAAQIDDPLTNSTFIGNLDGGLGVDPLKETDIQNFDLRYEVFMERGQTVSLSGFYKYFSNPIELVSFASDPGSIQPRNVGDGQVIGAELEARINLDFISEAFSNLQLNTNISVIDSRVRYDRSPGGEYDAKLNGLRAGESLGDYRDMQGQAPYIVNAGISYTDIENGWDGGVFYNVQGPKLAIVGINFNPNIYTVPFHSLKLNVNKKFGEDDKFQLGFGVDNLLGDYREMIAVSYRASEQIFQSFNPGTTVSVSFSYDLK